MAGGKFLRLLLSGLGGSASDLGACGLCRHLQVRSGPSGLGPRDHPDRRISASSFTPCCPDKKLFEVKRREQLLALKNLVQLKDVHQQYKILDVMLQGLFKVHAGAGGSSWRAWSLIWALKDE